MYFYKQYETLKILKNRIISVQSNYIFPQLDLISCQKLIVKDIDLKFFLFITLFYFCIQPNASIEMEIYNSNIMF